MLKARALAAWRLLQAVRRHALPESPTGMPVVIDLPGKAPCPPCYRRLGAQGLRIDMAERVLSEAHEARARAKTRTFAINPAFAVSLGLNQSSRAHLLRLAGFTGSNPPPLAEGMFGPPQPQRWRWVAPRLRAGKAGPDDRSEKTDPASPFAALAKLVR